MVVPTSAEQLGDLVVDTSAPPSGSSTALIRCDEYVPASIVSSYVTVRGYVAAAGMASLPLNVPSLSASTSFATVGFVAAGAPPAAAARPPATPIVAISPMAIAPRRRRFVPVLGSTFPFSLTMSLPLLADSAIAAVSLQRICRPLSEHHPKRARV